MKRTCIFIFSLTVMALLAASVIQISCNLQEKDDGAPFQPRGFKLTEHPEALFAEGVSPEDVIGTYTMSGDTRRVIFLGNVDPLVFQVDVPAGGKVRFGYGFGGDAFKYASIITLKGKLRHEAETIPLGEVSLNTRSALTAGRWAVGEWEIPEDISGPSELIFTIDGPKPGAPKDVFILANPTIVDANAEREPLRIIWIGIDTLRADHLGCYGYHRETSPNMDIFANEGALFERCISVCPWTYPSFAAMLTGRYPSIAGATTNVKFLPDGELTLAEILSEEDFATFSVVNSPWVGMMTNLQQGVDACHEYFRKRAEKSFGLAHEWLKRHPDEDCFVFIHLMDPHLPYRPKKENLGMFDTDYSGPYSKTFDMNHDEIELIRAGELEMDDADKNHIEALYDEEIFGCDQDFGAFIESLKADGFYDDSLIIITGDHGEEFWEHGGYEHGHQLYDEVLHVPLIVRGSGFTAGVRAGGLCSPIDIFPTILTWLGFETPGDINAVSLYDVLKGNIEPETRYLLSEQLYYGVEQKAASTDGYRYILHTLDDSEELYDISEDPGMLSDISADRRAAARGFRYFLKEITLNAAGGWHIRLAKAPGGPTGKLYEVTITTTGGFTHIESHGLNDSDGDSLKEDGDVLRIKARFTQPGEKVVGFTTPDEDVDVRFDIMIDGEDAHSGMVYLGPGKERYSENHFTLRITDERFGLGIPNFRKGKDTGVYIWGNSEGLREEMTPEIDDRVRDELRSLGYLQ